MKQPIDDGGPAFPVVFEHSNGEVVSEQHGMSLRDYFAAKALPPCMYICVNDTLNDGETRYQMFARKAYEIADAMLAAKEPQ